ncbi:MAG: TolC family outer membrane protein [Hyphomonadaceae bacterium]
MKSSLAAGFGALFILAPSAAWSDTLEEAIARALAGDPSIASVRTNLDAARANVHAAQAERWPTLSASVGYSSNWSESGGGGVVVNPDGSVTNTGGGGGTTNAGTAGVNVSETLFAGGRIGAGIAQAKAQAAQTAASVRGQEDALIVAVVAAYTGVAYGEEAVRIRRETVERFLGEVDAANARFEAGAATRTDVYQAQAQLDAARAALSSAQADLAASRATYARRVGAPPGTLEAAKAPVVPASLDQALTLAQANATVIQASAAGVNAAKARTRSAYAGFLPSLTVSAAGTRRGDDGFDNFDNDSSSVSARLSIPLFTFGRDGAAVSAAKANERGARYSLDDSVRAAEEATTQAWNRLEAAKLVVESNRSQLEAASFAARGAELERREGLRTQLDVLSQLQNERDAALALAQAQRDLVTSSYALLQAMGVMPRPTLSGNTQP